MQMQRQQKNHFKPVPEIQTLTRWLNPLDRVWKMKIYTQKNHQYAYEIPPGGTVDIDSLYDNGVQQVIDDVIVGGHGVQLVRTGTVTNGQFVPVGEELRPHLHEVLDDVKNAKNRQLEAEKAMIAASAAANLAAHELGAEIKKKK